MNETPSASDQSSVQGQMSVIGERLRTQDNRITSNPMFCVQEKVTIYGMDPRWSDDIVWIEIDDGVREIKPPRNKKQTDTIQKSAKTSYWKTVMAAFTEEGCKEYLALNGHNHRGETRIYVESWNRCPEMVAVRSLLMESPSDPSRVSSPATGVSSQNPSPSSAVADDVEAALLVAWKQVAARILDGAERHRENSTAIIELEDLNTLERLLSSPGVSSPVGGVSLEGQPCHVCGHRPFDNPETPSPVEHILQMELELLKRSVEITVFRNGKVLAVTSRRFGGFCGVGGKAESGETFEQAVRRELMEETGCEAKSIKFIAGHTLDPIKGDAPGTWYCAGFVVDIGDQEPQAVEDGTSPFWTTKEEMVASSLFPEWYAWWFDLLEKVLSSQDGNSPATSVESPKKFPYNPAHPIGTCAACGEEMAYNVPRKGAGGGFVHKSTGNFLCAASPVSSVERDAQKETGDL